MPLRPAIRLLLVHCDSLSHFLHMYPCSESSFLEATKLTKEEKLMHAPAFPYIRHLSLLSNCKVVSCSQSATWPGKQLRNWAPSPCWHSGDDFWGTEVSFFVQHRDNLKAVLEDKQGSSGSPVCFSFFLRTKAAVTFRFLNMWAVEMCAQPGLGSFPESISVLKVFCLPLSAPCYTYIT
jgi:hypothetical protein